MPGTLHSLLLTSAQAVVPPVEPAAPVRVLGFTLSPTVLAVLVGSAEVAGTLLAAALLLRLVPQLERLVLRPATRRAAVFDES